MCNAMNIHEPPAGDDVLHVRASVAPGEVPNERDLAFRARREVRVPGFGRRRHEPPIDVVEQRLAQAGSGRNQRHVAVTERFPVLQHVHLRLVQHGYRIRHRLQIVEQRDATESERALDSTGVDSPRDVGQLHGLVDHRSRGAEAGRFDSGRHRVTVLQERRDHCFEVVVVEGAKGSYESGTRTRRRGIEQSEESLGASDVAGQNHGRTRTLSVDL